MNRPSMVEPVVERVASTGVDLIITSASYDRSPELTTIECAALEYVALHQGGRGLDRDYRKLERLVRPIYDVLDAGARPHPSLYCQTRRRICIDMHRRRKAYWAWSEDEWVETVLLGGDGYRTFLFAVAYVLGGLSGPRVLENDQYPTKTARRIFGDSAVDAALDRVGRVVEGWG